MNIYRGKDEFGRPRKRIQKSTGKTDRAEAAIIEAGYMSMNKGSSTRERLLRLVDLMCPEEHQGLSLSMVGEWYRAAVKDEKAEISKKTMDARVNLCGRLSEWACRETRCHVVDDITVAVAWEFSKALAKGTNVKTKSRNAYMSELGTVWKMLVKRSMARENPWDRVRVQRNRGEEQHGRAFTREEEARILAVAREVGHDWYGACLLARYTGLRMKDVVQMKWVQIDFGNGWITSEPSKTAKHGIEVLSPIHRKVLDWLKAERAAHPDEVYVLPIRQRHNPNNKYRGGDVAFSTILKRAKVTDDNGGKTLLSFHCWRHTFDTRLAEAGVAQDVRMELTGHTVKETERIYNHDTSRLVKAIDAMD